MTRRAHLLGIDIGTTGIRAAVFTERGALVADAHAQALYNSPHPGWAEANPNDWWTTVVHLLRELRHTTPLHDIHAIAVVGQAPTVILVDAFMRVVRPAILWLDTRAAEQAERLRTPAYYLGPKLAWLAEHEPRSVSQTRFLLQSHAFVAHKLTGEIAFDRSTAALAVPLFDLGRIAWRDEAFPLLDSKVAASLRAFHMPEIRRSDDVLGVVTNEAAHATGLRAGTPVMVGGGDFAAAALGAGVLSEGEACLILGTAGNLLVPRTAQSTDPRLIHSHHVTTDAKLSLGGTLAGGATAWLSRLLCPSGTSLEALDHEAAAVPVGSEGLLFLPYLEGERTPLWDVTARGATVGWRMHHGRAHAWRAMLEGIALGFVDCQSVLADGDVELHRVIATDGGGKSALFRQILSDALGVPLAYAPGVSGTVAGAALLAGLGAGVLESPNEARAWRGQEIVHTPNPDSHACYMKLLGLRRRAYAGLADVNRELRRFDV